MYKCDDCGLIFNEPKAFYEHHGEGMNEMFIACPECGGAFSNVEKCVICGEIHTEIGDYCKSCKEEIDDMFSRFIRNVQNEFDIDRNKAVELINNSFERIW